jgi:hypothetical protein
MYIRTSGGLLVADSISIANSKTIAIFGHLIGYCQVFAWMF